MSVTIDAKTLVRFSLEEIWGLDEETDALHIKFVDGTIDADVPSTIFSWYLWELHRRFTKTPLLTRHHIQATRITKTTHINFMSVINEDLYRAYKGTHKQDEVNHLIMEIHNRMYNDFTAGLEKWVTSIDILDFIDVYEHPKVKAIREATGEGEHGIADSYNKLKSVLTDPNELIGNAVAESAKSNTTPINQIAQCVHIRGRMAGINGKIFKKAVMSNYLVGMNTVYESMVESESASKALIATKKPVSDAEVFNRVMQLINQSFLGVVEYDCGSKNHKEHVIRSDEFEQFLGKYHYDEEAKCDRPITGRDTKLIGKIVKLRNIRGCLHKGRQHVCRACFGELSNNIPLGTNIGHTSAVTTCKDVSQAIISTKHYDGTAIMLVFNIPEEVRKYMELGADPNHLLLTKLVSQCKDVKLTVSPKEARHLSDVRRAEDIDNLSTTRVSELTEVALEFVGYKGYDKIILPVSKTSRKSSMSKSFLKHIQKVGWEFDNRGDYVISLEGWDYDKPMFVLPTKQASMVDYFNTVDHVIKDKKSQTKAKASAMPQTLRQIGNPWEAVVYLHDIIRERFTINFVHMEVLVHSLCCVDPDNLDYRIPLHDEPAIICDLATIMTYRSLGAALSYAFHANILGDDPKQDLVVNRPYHLADDLILGSFLK